MDSQNSSSSNPIFRSPICSGDSPPSIHSHVNQHHRQYIDSQPHSPIDLKDILIVKMEPLEEVVQLSYDQDIIVPVMIDIRTKKPQNISQNTIGESGCDSAVECEKVEMGRRPLDLIFVIDLSISMRGKKMSQLRRTIGNLMNFLTDQDRMSVIGFNNSAQKLFRLAHLTKQNKKKVISILGSILPMGLTNITIGLLAGLDEIEASLLETQIPTEDEEEEQRQGSSAESSGFRSANLSSSSQQLSEHSTQQTEGEKNIGTCSIENRVRSIFLLSDGMDDRFEKNIEMLKNRFQTSRAQFSLNTFGYGEQHDALLMSAIADFKEGSFYYIEDIQNSDLYFADALGGLFSVIGNQLQFRLDLGVNNPLNVTINKVYGEMWEIEEKGQSRGFKLNEIFFGISKQIILELKIPKIERQPNFDFTSDLTLNSLLPKGTLKVIDPRGVQIEKNTYLKLKFYHPEKQPNNVTINQEVEINYLRVQCAEGLQEAMNSALQNEYQEGEIILEKFLKMITTSKTHIQNALFNLAKDLEESLVALKKKIFLHQNNLKTSSNGPSQTHLSFSSSQSTQDLKDFDIEKIQNIRRAFICKSRAHMEQRSVMINLDEYQNTVQKDLKKKIEISNKTKTFFAEEEEKETDQPVKKKKMMIPLQRKKFQSMNVGFNEISDSK